MKQKILYILVLITALLGGNSEAWAADNWGDLPISGKSCNFGSNGGGLNWSDKSTEIYFSGIPKDLTFNFDANDASSGVYWSISVSSNGTSWTNNKWASENNSGSATIELDPSVRYIRFLYSGNLWGNFSNISITERRYLTANKSSIDFGSVNNNATVQPIKFTISHCNAGSGVTIAYKSDNTDSDSKFSVNKTTLTSTGADKMGTDEISVSYDNSEVGNHSGKIIISDPNGTNESIEIPVKGSTTKEPQYPIFEWFLSDVATNSSYSNCFTTNNEDTDISFSSSDPSIANVVDGALVTYDKEGSATITVTQAGNDDWHAKTESYTITVKRPQNHLPLEITESNWSVLARNLNGGSFAWDGGIQHHSLAYGNREFEIAFTGIPDKLSFNYRVTDSNIDSEVKWTVYEGADGSNFTEAWTTGTEKGSIEIQLKPTTRYVRIKCYCIYYENVSNIKITELRYMNTETTDINFGEHYQGATVEPQTFVLNHCNVGAGAAVVSSNSNFIVNPINTTQTGGDIMGTETIAVTYLNNTEGEHAGTITITDPSGKNSTPVVINVSGKTKADRLILNPKESPNYEARTYQQVILNRTLPQGHFTATFPFEYDINAVEGAYIAQLAFVTYNSQDGYTLYLQKKEDGVMLANQPYVVYLPSDITNPQWTDVTVKVPVAGDITLDNWTMQGNYTPGVNMEGNYGIAGGKFRLGTEGSTINAYTAYFTFLGTQNVRARVAVMDEGGNTTYIGELKDGVLQTEEGIYGLDGVQQNQLRKGINIVRQKDGSVRKILK